MSLIQSIIYGFIQGITEFLPVSSSGHLVLLPELFKVSDPGVSFDLFMHVGTALAILVYFRSEVISLGSACLALVLKKDHHQSQWAKNYICSNIACFIFVLILMPLAGAYSRSIVLVGINLIVFGFLLYFFDWLSKSENKDLTKAFYFKESLLIGVSQAIAIFPGVSRSGATITMGRALNFDRDNIARYSFLLSLPIIFAGAIYKLLFKNSAEFNFDLIECLAGVTVSFLVGIITIHYFLKLISKIPFESFMIYRFILGACVVYCGIQ